MILFCHPRFFPFCHPRRLSSSTLVPDACPRRLSPIPDYKRRGQALIGDPVKEWIQSSKGSRVFAFFIPSSVILDACPRLDRGSRQRGSRVFAFFIPRSSTLNPRVIGDPVNLKDPGFLLFSFVRRKTLDPRSGSGMTAFAGLSSPHSCPLMSPSVAPGAMRHVPGFDPGSRGYK